MPFVLIGVAFALVLFLGWWLYHWQYRTAERVLHEWAAQQGLTVLEKAPTNDPYSGPGNRYASDKRLVYRIKVKNRDGEVRQGLARIGSEKLGTLQPQIEVQFDR